MKTLIRYFTYLGNIFPQFLICCFLLYLDFQQGYQVGSLWFWGYALNLLLKNTIRKKRPPVDDWEVPNVRGHSFPSGHSLMSLVLYWSIAKFFLVPMPLALILYTTPILLGLSRLKLKVHHTEDVLGGWIIAYMYLMWFETPVLKFQMNFYEIFYKILHLQL
jgi:membrane-associated phospholipid phosphatase